MTRVIPPLVFLHSLGGSAAHWEPLIARLRDRPDLASATAVPLPWTELIGPAGGELPSVVKAASKLADTEHPVVLIAHSSGATLAMAWAAAHPEQVLGLFLVEPAGSLKELPRKDVDAHIQRFTSNYAKALADHWGGLLHGAQPETSDQVRADLEATSEADIMAVTKGWVDFDPAAAIKRYGGPTEMILAGDGGPLSLAKLVPEVPVHNVLGTSHWVQLDAPDAVADALERFLTRIGASR